MGRAPSGPGRVAPPWPQVLPTFAESVVAPLRRPTLPQVCSSSPPRCIGTHPNAKALRPLAAPPFRQPPLLTTQQLGGPRLSRRFLSRSSLACAALGALLGVAATVAFSAARAGKRA